jgi:hypothetical protein
MTEMNSFDSHNKPISYTIISYFLDDKFEAERGSTVTQKHKISVGATWAQGVKL